MRGKYIIPGLSTAGTGYSVGVRVVEFLGSETASKLTDGPTWSLMIWAALFAASLAWLFGTLWADVWNSESSFRKWVAYKRRFFDVERVIPVSALADGNQEIRITVRLRFVRRLKGDLMIRPFGHVVDGKARVNLKTFTPEKGARLNKGQTLDVVLATLPVPSTSNKKPLPQPVWGKPEQQPLGTLVGPSRNIVSIEAHGLSYVQKFKVLIILSAGDAATSGQFVLTDENENLYELQEG